MTHLTGDDTLERVARLDPAPETTLDPAELSVAAATLEQILQGRSSSPRAAAAVRVGRRRTAARRTGAVVLAALLTVGGASAATGLTPTGLRDGLAALTSPSPPMLAYGTSTNPASAELLKIATAASGTARDPAFGDFVYLHWQAWTLGMGGERGDAIYPNERWAWIADDGSARTLVDWDGVVAGYKDWPPGGYAQPLAERTHLGKTPDEAASALTGASTAAASSAYQLLDFYTQRAATEGLGTDPADRALFLQTLAQTDVAAYGEVADRAGRQGQAFGASLGHDGVRSEIRIIVDPTTGALLASEEILHGPWILGSRETVGNYTTFIDNTRTSELPPCGDLGCTTMAPPG